MQPRQPVQAVLAAVALDGLGRFWPSWTQGADSESRNHKNSLLQTKPEGKTHLAPSCPGQAKSCGATPGRLSRRLPALLSDVKSAILLRSTPVKSDTCVSTPYLTGLPTCQRHVTTKIQASEVIAVMCCCTVGMSGFVLVVQLAVC